MLELVKYAPGILLCLLQLILLVVRMLDRQAPYIEVVANGSYHINLIIHQRRDKLNPAWKLEQLTTKLP